MKKIHVIMLFFLLFSVLVPSNAFAKEGDFYEKHKKELDNHLLSNEYLEVIKKYDSETNEFDCGKFEISCKITSTQLELAVGLAKFVQKGSEILVLKPEMITKDPAFKMYKKYLQTLSHSMLLMFMMWQLLAMVVRKLGDPDDYANALSHSTITFISAAVLLVIYQQVFDIILKIQHGMSTAVLDAGVTDDRLLLTMVIYTPQYSIIFSLFLGIVYIVFLIALLYRYVALGFFYAVGPIAIPTMVNDEFNYFQLWLKYIVNSVVTIFLQTMAFSMSMAALTNQFAFTRSLPTDFAPIAGIMLAIVFCLFALSVPSILGNFGSSTGTGRAMGKVVRYMLIKR